MKHRIPRVFAGACLLLASLFARADDARVVYYDIVGNSDRALRREMNAKGPIGDTGDRGDGHTRWDVTWNIRWAPTTGGCAITEVEVYVKGTITMPRWADENLGASALVTRWHRYLEALRIHEDGHYAHGIAAVEEIRSLGRSFRVFENCSKLGEAFNEQARSILDRYILLDKKYDTDTRHGETQGARFP